MSAEYRFLPWVRAGIAATVGGSTGTRVSAQVSLRINQHPGVDMDVRLYGPGDVIGLDPRQIVRTDPAHQTTDFEPNYFPAVELDHPDLPWLFSPALPDAGLPPVRGRLQPWLCLVVVRRQPGVTLKADPRRPLPSLVIAAPARPAAELPNLDEAWAWVHAQLVVDGTDSASLPEQLAADSPRNLARLVSPRRLEPRTSYLACVVPTFEVGCKAGLGLPITSTDEASQEPAWEGDPDGVELPVYHHFEFTTGVEGDFEALVQRLQPHRPPARMGSRRLQVGELGFGLPGLEGVWLHGALRTPSTPTTRIPEDFSDALRSLLNRRADRAPGQSPLLGPPVYGSWQAQVERVPAAGDLPGWLESLNLDPRHRTAAGFGTLIIQDQQEALMAAAWAQLADTRRANQELRRAQLSLQVELAIQRRHLATMAPQRLLQVTGPLHSRVQPAGGPGTLARQLRGDGLPVVTASTVLRRVARPRGPIGKRLSADGIVPVVQRLYQAPLVPPSPPRVGRLTTSQLQASLARLQQAVASERGASPTPSSLLLQALTAERESLQAAQSLVATPVRPDRSSTQVGEMLNRGRTALLSATDPTVTVVARARARIRPVAPSSAHVSEPGPEPDADLAPLALPAPHFPRPMYEALRDLSQDLLLPGLEQVPAETVMLLETNPSFVEAFMVGLNHEMGRELLWRGYPSDQRGTSFTHFWDSAGAESGRVQLPSIHTWPLSQPLGSNFMADGESGQLVLLIRGELLRRYPGAVIYAAPAASSTTMAEGGARLPLFRGSLEPDVTFLGFNLTAAEARGNPGWFFVIEQQPTEPRFGLDISQEFGLNPQQLGSWSQLSWGHLAPGRAAFEALSHLPLAAIPEGKTLDEATWKLNAAHMAAITLQPPMRVAIHARALLPA